MSTELPPNSTFDHTITRRKFVTSMAAAAAGVQFLTHPVFGQNAPSNKLKLACVGIAGMGKANLSHCTNENVVALCDVDINFSKEVRDKFPEARFYTDYREMFDKETSLDGVIIATPDHTHAVITMTALERGLNIYCQKPLCHSIFETRKITEKARETGVITQMGNQGRSTETIRLLKEWVDDGAIGQVREIHAWTDRPVGGNPWSTFPVVARPTDTPPIPDGFDWDLWLGPAPYRPYHPIYHPQTWRAFYDFGTGPLGDMGCHILDPSFYALELGAPSAVEAASSHWQPEVAEETYPRATRVKYEFPARNGKPPVTLHWSDGKLKPFRPKGIPHDLKMPESGAILVGDEGIIMHGSHGAKNLNIFPESLRRSYIPNRAPKTIPRVKGSHEAEWIQACKDGVQPCSNFDYGGPLTEMVLLGMLAIRRPNQRMEWNSQQMRITNNETANALVNPPYREGWKL